MTNTEVHIDDFREVMREHDGSVSSEYLAAHTDVESPYEAMEVIMTMWGRGMIARLGDDDEWILMTTKEDYE